MTKKLEKATTQVTFKNPWTGKELNLNTTGLTENEVKVMIGAITNCYNDSLEDGGTWSFAVCDATDLKEKSYRGVVSSLIKKGYATVTEDGGQDDPAQFLLTEAGKALYSEVTDPTLEALVEVVVNGKKSQGSKTSKEVKTPDTTPEKAPKSKKASKKTEPKFVVVRAFSGMLIGEFQVTSETPDTITVMTKDDRAMLFDKKTKEQLNYTGKPRFRSHIE